MVFVSNPPHRPASSPDKDACPAEPDAASTGIDGQAEMPLPSNPQTFFLGGLLTSSALAAIYVASSIILPVVLAVVSKLLLQPAVRVLERVHVPRAIATLVPILLVIGVLAGLVAAFSGPATTWAKRLPEGIPRLEAHLVVLNAPIQAPQPVIQQAEGATNAQGQGGSTVAVRQDLGLTGALFSGTRTILDGLVTTILVLYFLMVSGDTFLRHMVEILLRFRDKRQAVDISREIAEDISAHLVTITAMNAAVGVATAAAMYLCGGLQIPCCGEPRPSRSTTSLSWGRGSGSASSSSPRCQPSTACGALCCRPHSFGIHLVEGER